MWFKKQLVRALELPAEVVLGQPLLTMTGREELFVENYKGLLEYTTESLRLHTGAGCLHIKGRGLALVSVHADAVLIRGRILSITFAEP